jgi:hypothetical protein
MSQILFRSVGGSYFNTMSCVTDVWLREFFDSARAKRRESEGRRMASRKKVIAAAARRLHQTFRGQEVRFSSACSGTSSQPPSAWGGAQQAPHSHHLEHLHHLITQVIDHLHPMRPDLGLSNGREVSLWSAGADPMPQLPLRRSPRV